MRRMTSRALPPVSAVRKLPWRSLTLAEPMRRPLHPAMSMSLPAETRWPLAPAPGTSRSRVGFLKQQPAELSAMGWLSRL